MSDWSHEKINKLLNEVNKKASEDMEFRRKLINDPKNTINKLTNENIPENINVNFVENSKWNKTFILSEFQGDELSDDDLEHVAGGKSDCSGLKDCKHYH